MSRTWRTALPRAYAREKLRMLRRRWEGATGEHLRAMGPRVWPGVPPLVWLGFTAFSTGPKENTTEAVPEQDFHEIGLFQVEAGPRSGPAPNPDPSAEDNSWGELADDPLVVELLGRPAAMGHDDWKRPEHLADQIAVGLVNLLRRRDGMSRTLPLLAPKDPASWWAVAWAMTAFSRGRGQTRKVLGPYDDEKLVGVPEDGRWTTWRSVVALDLAKGVDNAGTAKGRGGAPRALVRTDQKLESGALCADTFGDDADRAWFRERYRPEDAAIEEALTRRAYDL